MRKWLAWLGLIVLVGCSIPNSGQGGGGEQNILAPTVVGNVVCFELPSCEPIYIVITATQFTAWTPTLSPTPTATVTPTATITPTATRTLTPPPPTPSMVTPDGTEITAIAGTPMPCLVEPYAISHKGVYTYTDSANSGLEQRIRSRPGTEFSIVGYLPKNQPRTTYYLKWRLGTRWYAITQACDQWVSGALGTIEE